MIEGNGYSGSVTSLILALLNPALVPLKEEKMSEYKTKEFYREQVSRDLNDTTRAVKEISIVELFYFLEIMCDIRDELKRIADSLEANRFKDLIG